jgi:hypothetical protein
MIDYGYYEAGLVPRGSVRERIDRFLNLVDGSGGTAARSIDAVLSII